MTFLCLGIAVSPHKKKLERERLEILEKTFKTDDYNTRIRVVADLLEEKHKELAKRAKVRQDEVRELQEYQRMLQSKQKVPDTKVVKEENNGPYFQIERSEKSRVKKVREIKKWLNNSPESQKKNFKLDREDILLERKEAILSGYDEVNPKVKKLLTKLVPQQADEEGPEFREAVEKKIDQLTKINPKNLPSIDISDNDELILERLREKSKKDPRLKEAIEVMESTRIDKFVLNAFKQNYHRQKLNSFSNRPNKEPPKEVTYIEKVVEKVVYIEKENFTRASREMLESNKRKRTQSHKVKLILKQVYHGQEIYVLNAIIFVFLTILFFIFKRCFSKKN